MSRLPRTLVPGYPAHVLHRGNNRGAIFRCDSDYLHFRHCLAEARRRCEVEIHAFVFMTNHVHLLLTPLKEGEASRFVQSAARRYVGYFNARYGRTGTLWEGRFRSAMITSDDYLFKCHRYVDMNPVRAGMVEYPGDYRWSSHGYYSQGAGDSLVQSHPLIVALAADDRARRGAYRRMFEMPLTDEDLEAIRSSTRRRSTLGAEADRPGRRPGRPGKSVSDTSLRAGDGA